MRRREHRINRLARGASPAVLAALLALQPQMAVAQAFQGTPTTILGNVNRSIGTGSETLVVGSPQATINWLPTDTAITGTPINFLPAGTSANFAAASGAPYTVLNRIIAADPTRAIQLAGQVTSDAVGNIWFYAPGGLLISSTARFDVGGLLLTANDPVGAAAGTDFINAGNNFQLAAASNSTAGIDVQAGAVLSASNSYLIAVAPRITMNGAMNLPLAGSAALVMAEDVSFTLNGGLFDITANIGSAAGGINEVGGSITGAGGIAGQGVFSRIYMMAVPRNVGMTLLISGGAQLGFDIANAVDVDGNAIVLSGGYDIVGSPIATGIGQFSAAPVAGAAAANVVVDNRQITSQLALRSNDFGRVQATLGDTSAAANVEIYADNQALARASNGFTLGVTGDLRSDASALPVLGNGQNRAASLASVLATTGGRISVTGNILALALGVGEDAFSPGVAAGAGFGGTARISATDAGSAISGQQLILDASGIGGIAADGAGGSATGGFAELRLGTGASLTVGGTIDIRGDAVAQFGAPGRASGNAQGNAALLELEAGTSLTMANGGILVSANGRYGEATAIAHTGGGTARGGTAVVRVQNGAVLETQDLAIFADAFGPPGGGGNSFAGGQASLLVNDTAGATGLTVIGDLQIAAAAIATDGDPSGNADGGNAAGGTAEFIVTGNPLINLATISRFSAEGVGGDGAGSIGQGGSGTGGTVTMTLGGSFTLPTSLELRALGIGGASTTSNGAATGGSVSLTISSGTTDIGNALLLTANGAVGPGATISDGSGGTLSLSVATGASLLVENQLQLLADGSGFNGSGGQIGISNAGRLNSNLGGVTLQARSGGDVGSAAATLTGGTITVTNSATGIFSLFGALSGDASALPLGPVAAGLAQGGDVTLSSAGQLTIGGSILLFGTAGHGGPSADGGNAVGGDLGVIFNGGTASVASIRLFAGAFGADSAGNAGNGTGGNASVAVNGGTQLVIGEIEMQTTSFGGNAQGSGNGGNGSAGDISLSYTGAGTLASGGGAILLANAQGGNGAAAGNGTAGDISLNVAGGAQALLSSSLDASATGSGGVGNGGAGGGGAIAITAGGSGSRLELVGGFVSANGVRDAAGTGPASAGTTSLLAAANATIAVTAPLTIDASGLDSLGAEIGQAGTVQLQAQGGGQINLLSLDARAAGALAPAGAQRSGLIAGTGSTITLAGEAFISAVGDIGLNDGGTITAARRLQLVSGGRILSGLSAPAAGATGTVTARDLFIEAAGGITLATGLATSTGDLGLISGGSLAVGTLASARHAVLLAAGDIATGGITTGATGQLYVGSYGQRNLISFPSEFPPDYTALLATPPQRLAGGISINGPISTGALQLAATGPILLGGTVAATSILLDSGAAISLTGAGGNATALTLISGSDVSLGAIQIAGDIVITAAGNASLAGTVAAANLTVTSASIALAQGAVIGGNATTAIQLNATAGTAVIGGAGTTGTGVYSLSNSEFGTLRATNIRVTLPGTATLEQLDLPASAINLESVGLMRITGAVTMAQAGTSSLLGLRSGSRIEVVQGSGSILLGSSADAPSGTLQLRAGSIRVATATVLDQIAAGTLTGEARNQALNAAPVAGSEAGSIAAGSLRLTASNDVLIQNSGTLRTRAGFTAGAGGLALSAVGGDSVSQLLDVVINGRILTPGGSFAINNDTIDLVKVEPSAAALTSTSQVNACRFGQPCLNINEELLGPIVTLLTSVQPLTPEVQRTLARLGQPAVRLPYELQQRLFDFGPLFQDADSTDPVTSGGNPALWLDVQPPAPRPSGGQ